MHLIILMHHFIPNLVDLRMPLVVLLFGQISVHLLHIWVLDVGSQFWQLLHDRHSLEDVKYQKHKKGKYTL